MIKTALAKELKYAGFAQKGKGEVRPYLHPIQVQSPKESDYVPEQIMTSEPVYLPTLSELIGACGETFYSLVTSGNELNMHWIATCRLDQDLNQNFGEGDTAEEAVANLWLSLNHEKNS